MSPKNPVPGEVVEVQVDGEAGGVQQVGQSRRHRVATQLLALQPHPAPPPPHVVTNSAGGTPPIFIYVITGIIYIY